MRAHGKSIICTAEQIKYQKLQYCAFLSSCSLNLRLSIPCHVLLRTAGNYSVHISPSLKLMSVKWNVTLNQTKPKFKYSIPKWPFIQKTFPMPKCTKSNDKCTIHKYTICYTDTNRAGWIHPIWLDLYQGKPLHHMITAFSNEILNLVTSDCCNNIYILI